MKYNDNIENPSQKMIPPPYNMFDYIVRLLGWAVEGDECIATPCIHFKHPTTYDAYKIVIK